MSYQEIIQAGLSETRARFQEDYRNKMSELRRWREIDLFLRSVVCDAELLDFLRARDARAVLVKDSSNVNGGLHKVMLDARDTKGRIFLPLKFSEQNIIRVRGGFYSLIPAPQDCKYKLKHQAFIGAGGLAFVCTYNNRTGETGELLSLYYDDGMKHFEGQNAEMMQRTLEESIREITQGKKD